MYFCCNVLRRLNSFVHLWDSELLCSTLYTFYFQYSSGWVNLWLLCMQFASSKPGTSLTITGYSPSKSLFLLTLGYGLLHSLVLQIVRVFLLLQLWFSSPRHQSHPQLFVFPPPSSSTVPFNQHINTSIFQNLTFHQLSTPTDNFKWTYSGIKTNTMNENYLTSIKFPAQRQGNNSFMLTNSKDHKQALSFKNNWLNTVNANNNTLQLKEYNFTATLKCFHGKR